jgi:hypothetical protein
MEVRYLNIGVIMGEKDVRTPSTSDIEEQERQEKENS